jgi:type IV pilus assembly protein PilB
MDQHTLNQLHQLLHKPHGMLLFAGPPGAGKTTTLHAALNELNQVTEKIIADDPVACGACNGIVRCQIGPGLGFAQAVPAILAQDPDIIVVGEIRDRETAQAAVQLALSGRRVLGTVDAADAASSIARLRGLGLEPSALAATVTGILAQQVVRKLCENCRTEIEPTEDMLRQLSLRPEDVDGKLYQGHGCDRCHHFGHRGRMGIFELLLVNDPIRSLVSAGASTDELRQACRRLGMTTLRASGLRALFEGKTSVAEVVREALDAEGESS